MNRFDIKKSVPKLQNARNVTSLSCVAYNLIVLTKERKSFMKLSELELGERAYVTKVRQDTSISRRLLDIGLIPGTKVECVLMSPSLNPKAYMIRGAVIAVRNEDALGVDIKI